jgi:hypothetical protein
MDAMAASRSEFAVDAVLARFPGPIVLWAPRGRAIRGLVSHVCLVGVFVWLCATVGTGNWIFWVFVGCALWELLGAAIRALQLAKIVSALRFDSESILQNVRLRERCYRWSTVERFTPLSWWPFQHVLASRADGSPLLIAAAAGMTPTDLALLLTRWRERALAEA